jgi:hypothetical protein
VPPESASAKAPIVPAPVPNSNARTWQTEAWKRELERTAAQPAKNRRRSIA